MRKLAHRAGEEGGTLRALFNEFFHRKRTLRFVAIVCLSLLYWLQAAPSYDVEGLRALSSRSLPAFLMIFRVAFVIVLFAVVPIVKGHVLGCEERLSASLRKRSHRTLARTLLSFQPTPRQEAILFAVFLLALLAGGEHVRNELIGTKGFVLVTWLYEVVLRRRHAASALVQLVCAAALELHLAKVMGIHDSDLGQLTLHTASEFARSLSFLPAVSLGIGAVSLLLLFINFTAKAFFHSRYPSRIMSTPIVFSHPLLWVLLSAQDVLVKYLFRASTLASIFICYEQLVRHGQLRSIPPTIGFALVETVGIFVTLFAKRRSDNSINRQSVRASTADSLDSLRAVRRQNLQPGMFALLRRGDEVPGTCVVRGLVDENVPLPWFDPTRLEFHERTVTRIDRTEPGQVLISTRLLDGESNDKDRYVTSASLATLLHTLPGAKVSGPRLTDDSMFARHINILRQGAQISRSQRRPVWVEFFGFVTPSRMQASPTFVDGWLRLVGTSVALSVLSVFTLHACILAGYFHRPLNWDTLVETFLICQVCIPLSLPAIVATVLSITQPSGPLHYGIAGRKAVIGFTELRSRALQLDRRGQRRVKWVHLTDKTGTLTQNKMAFLGCIDLRYGRPFRVVEGPSTENSATAAWHMACTQNTPEAPHLVAEEHAYSTGLGVKMTSITRAASGWETHTYEWQSTVHTQRRLFLEFSSKHRCVFALLALPGDLYQFVAQGSPEAAAGQTGLRMRPVAIPSLRDAHEAAHSHWVRHYGAEVKIPDGAQRNWLYMVSEPQTLSAPALAALEAVAQRFREAADVSSLTADLSARDAVVETIEFTPMRYMLLVDEWRPDASRAANWVADQEGSFWIVTGDGLANSIAVARAMQLHEHMHTPLAVVTGSVEASCAAFFKELEQLPVGRPMTLLLGTDHQRMLACFDTLTGDARRAVADVLCAADSKGRPLFHVVCYASETHLKGALVRFAAEVMQVATVMSGDGTNDVAALLQAGLSIALPSASTHGPDHARGPDDSSVVVSEGEETIHSLVAAAAHVHATGDFWVSYTRSQTRDFGLLLWQRLFSATLLLALKQSATAGLVLTAATRTSMESLADPFFPAQYQMFQAAAFALVVVGAVLPRPASPDANRPRLSLRRVAITMVAAHVWGMILLVCSSVIVQPEPLECCVALQFSLLSAEEQLRHFPAPRCYPHLGPQCSLALVLLVLSMLVFAVVEARPALHPRWLVRRHSVARGPLLSF